VTTPLWCLLGFAMWTLAVVVVGIGTPRVSMVLAGKARPNEFRADVPHGSDLYRRTMRAHANCVENLPIFGAIVLTAAVAGADTLRMDRLAVAVLLARIAQTITHVSSGRSLVVNVRFGFFLVQIASFVAMVVEIGRRT